MRAAYEPGSLVRSLAGHDKDRYFIILKEEGEYVTLADGKLKTLEQPKRKKKKHVQPINKKVLEGIPQTNEEIRSSVKRYVRSHCGNQEVGIHVESRCD